MLRLFDFKCNECDHQFEKMIQHTERETDCKKCGNLSIKQMSIPTPIFKGTGFYHTDYKRKDPSYKNKISRK